MADECGKYGKVLQCHVVRDSPSGLVYVRFDSPEGCTSLNHHPPRDDTRNDILLPYARAAAKAAQALGGRWFAGKVISAELIEEKDFQAGLKL